MEVEMKIRGLMMDPVTNMPIVVLKDVQGQAILPIWVGVYEANAIALEIEKVQTPRPMTHDLLKNVLLGLEVRVQKVVVNDLKDDTFYALIWVERDGQMMTIDSRPSDPAPSPNAAPTNNSAPGSKASPTTTSAATRCSIAISAPLAKSVSRLQSSTFALSAARRRLERFRSGLARGLGRPTGRRHPSVDGSRATRLAASR
jgi:bifunctional DNase/RNase